MREFLQVSIQDAVTDYVLRFEDVVEEYDRLAVIDTLYQHLAYKLVGVPEWMMRYLKMQKNFNKKHHQLTWAEHLVFEELESMDGPTQISANHVIFMGKIMTVYQFHKEASKPVKVD